MEISKTSRNNLEFIENLNDEVFNKLLTDCMSLILSRDKNKNLFDNYTTKTDIIKSGCADLLCLFVETARKRYETENLRNFLNSSKLVRDNKVNRICDVYNKHKDHLMTKLSAVGDTLPCLVDVNWKVDYCLKTSTNNLKKDCLYHIDLVTKQHGVISTTKFVCNVYQLQELIYKLKDAVRHVEKISNI